MRKETDEAEPTCYITFSEVDADGRYTALPKGLGKDTMRYRYDRSTWEHVGYRLGMMIELRTADGDMIQSIGLARYADDD